MRSWLGFSNINKCVGSSSAEDPAEDPAKETLEVPQIAGGSMQNPVASSSKLTEDQTLQDLARMSVDDSQAHEPAFEPTPACDPEEGSIPQKIQYLRAHQFPVNLGFPFPHLEKIFPRGQQRSPRCLTAFFILCPAYQMTEDHLVSSYFCQAEISQKDLREIEKASPKHIKVIKPKDRRVGRGKVYCSYHSWVREQWGCF